MALEHHRAGVRRDRRGKPLLGLVPVVGLVAAFCVLVLGSVAVLMAETDRSFGYFSGDPAATLGAHPFVGLLSHVGVLIAWGTAVACLLAAAYLPRARDSRHVSPLLAAGLAIAYLALDDLFQLHEEVFPKMGVDQVAVLSAYAVVTILYLWWYRDFFREHEWPLLAITLVALGASVALDQFGEAMLGRNHNRFFEESFKLFGLALLGTYFIRLIARMHDNAYSPSPREFQSSADPLGSSDDPANAVATPSAT